MCGDVPGVIGQTPTKLEGSQAAPEGHRATGSVKAGTWTGATAPGRVKPEGVCQVHQVPAQKLS